MVRLLSVDKEPSCEKAVGRTVGIVSRRTLFSARIKDVTSSVICWWKEPVIESSLGPEILAEVRNGSLDDRYDSNDKCVAVAVRLREIDVMLGARKRRMYGNRVGF
jgi:hypothetical protein